MPLCSSRKSNEEKIGCWRGGTVELGSRTCHEVESVGVKGDTRLSFEFSERSNKFRNIPSSWKIAINDTYCNLISQDNGIMSLFTPVHMSNAFASVGKQNASRRVAKEFTDVILNEIGMFLYLIQVRVVFFHSHSF